MSHVVLHMFLAEHNANSIWWLGACFLSKKSNPKLPTATCSCFPVWVRKSGLCFLSTCCYRKSTAELLPIGTLLAHPFLDSPVLDRKNYVYYVWWGKESQIACQCRSQLQCSRSQKGVRSDKERVFSTCCVKSPIVYLKVCALEAQKYIVFKHNWKYLSIKKSCLAMWLYMVHAVIFPVPEIISTKALCQAKAERISFTAFLGICVLFQFLCCCHWTLAFLTRFICFLW